MQRFGEPATAAHPRRVEDSSGPGQATSMGQACGCEEQANGIAYKTDA